MFADGGAQDGVSIADGDTLERADLVWARNLWWGTGLFHEAPVSAETSLVEDPLYRDPSAGDLGPRALSPLHDAGQLADGIPLWEGAFWAAQFPGLTAFPAHGELDHAQRPRMVGTIDIGAFEAQ